MIVMLYTYLYSLRLSVVQEGLTSVRQTCSSLICEDLSVASVCLDSGNREQSYSGLWFLPVCHRSIPDTLLVLLVVVGAYLVPPRIASFVLCVLSGVSLFSLCFLPLSFSIYFLWLLKSAWSCPCGGQHCCGRVMPYRLRLAMLRRITFVSGFFFVIVGHWVIERPQNASGGGLLELLLYHSPKLLFWHYQQLIPLIDNRVVGSVS